jgi:hypothetical protein
MVRAAGAALAIGQRLVAHGQQMGSCVPVRVRAACVLVLLTGSRNSGARAHVYVPYVCAPRAYWCCYQVKKFWGTRPRTCPGKVSVCSPGVSLISAQYPSAANLLSVGWEILGIGALSWTGVKVESTWTRSLLRLPRKAGMSVIKNFGTQGKG